MRTRTRQTRNGADPRNGRLAVMLHGGDEITEFVGRMSWMMAPIGCAAENERKAKGCSTFLSRPTWIRTGTFDVTSLRETPCETHSGYNGFLSKATWMRTGIFTLTAHPKGVPHETPACGAYGAFLSRPSWINTGAFGLPKGWGSAAVGALFKVFAGTWMTTGIFEPVTSPEPSEQPLRLAA